MVKCFTFLILIIFPLSMSVPNCIQESATGCTKCEDGFALDSNDSCSKCIDQNCQSCIKPRINSCLQCNTGFKIANKQCGVRCDSLPNCEICSPDLNQCISCRSGCKISEGQCICSSKLISITICVIISLIVVIVVTFCLTNTTTSRKNKLFQLALNVSTNESDIIQSVENAKKIVDNDDTNYHSDNKKKTKKNYHEPQQLTIISTEPRVSKSFGEEKSLCDYCLVETSIERLICGCHLCIRHHSLFKNKTGDNKCPVCHKEAIVQETLSELQVCNSCWRDQEKNENKCPNCINL